jgi:hypothetical protein
MDFGGLGLRLDEGPQMLGVKPDSRREWKPRMPLEG